MCSALPTPPTWMERDTVRVRSPDQEHNKMTPIRAQTRIGPLDSESSEVQRHPILWEHEIEMLHKKSEIRIEQYVVRQQN